MNKYWFRGLALFGFITVLMSIRAQIQYQGSVSSLVSLSTNELKPLWIYSNNWGLLNAFNRSEAFIKADAEIIWFNKNNFNLNTGAALLLKSSENDSPFHELYVSGNFYFVDFIIGKKAFSPLGQYDKLGTGSYLLSSNARPVPRISLGIFEFKAVPFTQGWLDVKSFISQGFLNEKPEYLKTGNVLLHEKFAYLRLSKFKVKPYAGLVHSALFGGEYSNGQKIPIDFWATFKAKGSEKIGGGELTNAAGAHEGFWDFGLDVITSLGQIHLALHKPFTDRNGYSLNRAFRLNHDFIITLDWKLNESKVLNRFLVEYFKSNHQSGEGIPDPMFPAEYTKDPSKVGHLIFPWLINDWSSFMEENFVGIPTPEGGWNEERFNDFWEKNFNNDHYYGGRADNLNNGLYYRGYTYMGQSMGTPLFHTYPMVKHYAAHWQPINNGIFINNRVRALNIGLQGNINIGWEYALKFTYSLNDGNWAEKYKGRYSWELSPDYFFVSTKKQVYSYFEVKHQNIFSTSIDFIGSMGFDFGDLYHSYGVNVGLTYRF